MGTQGLDVTHISEQDMRRESRRSEDSRRSSDKSERIEKFDSRTSDFSGAPTVTSGSARSSERTSTVSKRESRVIFDEESILESQKLIRDSQIEIEEQERESKKYDEGMDAAFFIPDDSRGKCQSNTGDGKKKYVFLDHFPFENFMKKRRIFTVPYSILSRALCLTNHKKT
tara:strand:- start:449 stop:961 length:513 start_codon:yes stop_codon:yes gene_type:complete